MNFINVGIKCKYPSGIYRSVLTALFICFIFIMNAAYGQTKQLQLSSEQDGGRIRIYAQNPNFYPVTIELDMNLENAETEDPLPVIRTLSAGEKADITRISIKEKGLKWSYETSYVFYMGDIHAVHNERFAYRLPYDIDSEYKIDQGFGGDFSHTGESYYALDFNLEEDTRIVAARGGLVVRVEESSDEGGVDRSFIRKANVITILHDDGTFADYSHLRKNGAVVQERQRVRMGQVIGYSGSTGYATGPHLHFVVKKARKGGGFTSVPVRFKTQQGIVLPEEGKVYRAY